MKIQNIEKFVSFHKVYFLYPFKGLDDDGRLLQVYEKKNFVGRSLSFLKWLLSNKNTSKL